MVVNLPTLDDETITEMRITMQEGQTASMKTSALNRIKREEEEDIMCSSEVVSEIMEMSQDNNTDYDLD